MKKLLVFFVLMMCMCFYTRAQQQNALPAISVKNINNKIIVSWINDYTKTVTALNVQRSYDSLKNYTTIGSVLSPQSRENGYADANPPYNKMYYRVFAAFEGGTYIITNAVRPIKDTSGNANDITIKYPWMNDATDVPVVPTKPGSPAVPLLSTTVFTAKDNNVIIHLPDYSNKKYTVKFYDENEKMIFELNKLKEEYLIIEKVNFRHTGNFRFELYENGLLIEKNKFQILKDLKKL
jgi:hypothetical protein